MLHQRNMCACRVRLCVVQACLVYLELILIAQYIFQIPTHLNCRAISKTTEVSCQIKPHIACLLC